VAGARARSANLVPTAGLASLVLGPGILPGRRPPVTLTWKEQFSRKAAKFAKEFQCVIDNAWFTRMLIVTMPLCSCFSLRSSREQFPTLG